MSLHGEIYDAARRSAVFASQSRMEAALQYRAQEIGDAEFCAVHAAWKAANDAFDVATTIYIETCNATNEI
jgi:hypothetical protein